MKIKTLRKTNATSRQKNELTKRKKVERINVDSARRRKFARENARKHHAEQVLTDKKALHPKSNGKQSPRPHRHGNKQEAK